MNPGTWPSPISAADVAAGTVRLDDVVVTNEAVWFTRTEPSSGTMRLWRWRPGAGGPQRVGGDLDVRTRVHEYGSGAVMASDDVVVVSNFTDQRLYRVRDDEEPVPITPETDGAVRYAAGCLVDDNTAVLVRETHAGPGAAEVRNELVRLDLETGGAQVLVDGHDFVGDPVAGPDGRIAWVTWDHPDMPWDASRLWVGRLDGDGLVDRREVAGGDGVSIAGWAWKDDGLVWTDDRTGFWEVYADDGAGGRALTAAGFDLGQPRWQLGRHSLAVDASGRLAVLGVRDAHARVGLVVDGAWEPLSPPDVTATRVVAGGGCLIVERWHQSGAGELMCWAPDGSPIVIDRVPAPTNRPGDRSSIVPVWVGEGEERTHAFFHPPANADVAEVDGPPPLVMFLHGGPTSHVSPVATVQHAFWTTRGFAVADLNYRGSSGFGRDYRRLMRGRWGEIEVADAIAVARDLADRGWVDGDRMAIRGGSAGGFTALAVVTRPDQPFACATSFFGVTDLAALADVTHKFESRYLDRMVGPLPEARETYDARSPLANVDHLAVPILVLQGTEDRVVPPAQAEAVVKAAAERGIPHAYLLFEGEAHGFRRPENIAAWHEAELAFYGEVMGFTPAGDLPTVLGE